MNETLTKPILHSRTFWWNVGTIARLMTKGPVSVP